MKKSIIMIAVLTQSLYLSADEITASMGIEEQVTLEEKNLLKRQVFLKNKQVAWKKHKKSLIKSFKERHAEHMHLGKEDYYGKLRLEARKQDFYASLKSKDDDIAQRLRSVKKRLKAIKKHYILSNTLLEN